MKNFVKKILISFLFLAVSNSVCFCGNEEQHSQTPEQNIRLSEQELMQLLLMVQRDQALPELRYILSETLLVLYLDMNNFEEATRILNENNSDLNLIMVNDIPILNFFIKRKNNQAVNWLLNNGAFIRRIDKNGNTALHYSAYYGDTKSLILLIQKLKEMGNDILLKEFTKTNRDNAIPMMYAKTKDTKLILFKTLEYCSKHK